MNLLLQLQGCFRKVETVILAQPGAADMLRNSQVADDVVNLTNKRPVTSAMQATLSSPVSNLSDWQP